MKKVSFIKDNSQDFKHPSLMLHAVRFLNMPLRLTSRQDIVVLGRYSTAVFGSLIVLIFYFISRLELSRKYSLLVCLGIAVSPITVIHSHYLKEDSIFTFFALCSLFCFLRYLKDRNPLSMVFFGVATGLAFSSHYKGLLFIPIYFTVPFLVSKSINTNRRLFIGVLIAFIVAFVIFLAVNYPLIFDFGGFINALYFDFKQILHGHTLKHYPFDDFFLFHLKNSIIPGTTILVTVAGVAFIIYSLLNWRKTGWLDRILLFYFLVFYFAIELAPCKPFPGYMRYVIPFVPVLIYFAFRAISFIDSSTHFHGKGWLTSSLAILLICIPLIQTVRLDYHLKKDTREIAERYFEGTSYNPIYQKYGSKNWMRDIWTVDDKSIEEYRKEDVTHLVTSSFLYERDFIGTKLENQDLEVYGRHNSYVELFKYPYIEIKPAYKSFAFSNPTIRIVDIRKEPEEGCDQNK